MFTVKYFVSCLYDLFEENIFISLTHYTNAPRLCAQGTRSLDLCTNAASTRCREKRATAARMRRRSGANNVNENNINDDVNLWTWQAYLFSAQQVWVRISAFPVLPAA